MSALSAQQRATQGAQNASIPVCAFNNFCDTRWLSNNLFNMPAVYAQEPAIQDIIQDMYHPEFNNRSFDFTSRKFSAVKPQENR